MDETGVLPADANVIDAGTEFHALAVRTSRHRVPYGTRKKAKEGEEHEHALWYVNN